MYFSKYFNVLCLIHVSKPGVHLQEDGCVHKQGTVCFVCISINSLVDQRAAAGRTTRARQVSSQLPDEDRYSLLEKLKQGIDGLL